MKPKILFMLLIILSFFSFKAVSAEKTRHIGLKLIDLEAKTLDGKKVKIQDEIEGKISVLNFTTTWCYDCKKLARVLGNIIPKYREKCVAFCFIYIGQKKETVIKSSAGSSDAETPLKFFDEKRKSTRKLNLTSVPYVIIVDSRGIVRYEGLPLKEAAIVDEIEKIILQQNKKVSNMPF